jgi:hypothetical protein
MSSYSREVQAVLTASGKNCIVLPTPARGELQRLIVKQTAGTGAAFSGVVYDRRGACENEIDLNVKGGGITASANNGGNAQFTTDADHNLLPGDTVYIKGTSEVAYDGIVHTVDTVESSTQFTTTTAHASVVAAGYWQTEPLADMPIRDPAMHTVTEFVSQVSGTTYKNTTVEEQYENRDNQDVTARRRATQLYLELDVDQANTTWEVSYTCAIPSSLL